MELAVALSRHSSGISSFRLGEYIFGALGYVGFCVGLWGILRKAGRPGWHAIIPIWNLYVYCRVVRGTGWFLILLLIPFVNLVAGLVLLYDLARSFDRKWGWFIGLWLLPFVFFPVLGWGRLPYLGPAGDPSARDAFGKITRR